MLYIGTWYINQDPKKNISYTFSPKHEARFFVDIISGLNPARGCFCKEEVESESPQWLHDNEKTQLKWSTYWVPRVIAQTKLELSSRSSLSAANDEILAHAWYVLIWLTFVWLTTIIACTDLDDCMMKALALIDQLLPDSRHKPDFHKVMIVDQVSYTEI